MAVAAKLKVTFDLVSDSPTYGKFILESTTDLAGEGIADADVSGKFEVKSPTNDFYFVGSLNPPDIIGTPFISAKFWQGGTLDDLVSGGAYVGTDNNFYEVKVTAIGATDSFQWRKGTGAWSADILMTGLAQVLGEGVEVTFGATTGHAIGDRWIIYVRNGTFIKNDLDVPTTSGGDWMEGNYEFKLTLEIGGAVQPGTYTTGWIQHEFCIYWPDKPSITVTANCFQFLITAKDASSYGDYASIEREFILHPPSIAGDPDYEVDAPELEYVFTWTGNYELLLTTNLVYDYPNDIHVLVDVTGSKDYLVNCDYNLCSLITCFNKFITKFDNSASDAGGERFLPKSRIEEYISVIAKFQAFQNLNNCGKYTEAQKRYDELKEILDCDCGCGDSGTPTQVNPGVVAGSSYNFLKNYPVIVTVSGNNVTYGLDATWLANVNALYQATVISGDDSLTVTPTILGSGVHQFDVRFPNPPEQLAYLLKIQHQVGAPFLVFTVSRQRIQGGRHQAAAHELASGAFATLNQLRPLLAAFRIKTFILAGANEKDKIFIEMGQIKLAGSAEYQSNPQLIRPEVYLNDVNLFEFRLIYVPTGLPIIMNYFINTFEEMYINVLITN